MSDRSVKESRGSYLADAAKELVAAASEASFDATTFFDKFELLAETSGAIAKLRQIVLHIAFKGGLTKRNGENRDEQLLAKIDADVDLLAGKKRSQSKRQMVESSEQPFDIPESWRWTTLGRIGNWGSGSTPKRGTSEYYNGTFSWLKSGELNDARNLIGSEEKVTEIAIKQCSFRLNQKGDILFAMYGATVGKVAILGEEAVTNQAVCGCTPSRYVDNVFLYFYLISQRQTFRDTSEGGAQPNFSKDKIVNFPFPLPPLAEQKRIVAKVDELMGLCDRLEALEAERKDRHASLSRAALARFAAAPTPTNLQFLFRKSFDVETSELSKLVLDMAVRGQLTTQTKADGDARNIIGSAIRSTDEKILQKLRAINDEAVEFTLPTNWIWCRLGQIISSFRYGTSKKCDRDATLSPVLRIPNIQSGRVDSTDLKYTNLTKSELKDLGLQEDDLLMVRSNGSESLVGRSAVVTSEYEGFSYAGYLVRARPSGDSVFSRYLQLSLSTTSVRNQIERPIRTTSGVKNINTTEIANLLLPLPPLAEQKRIVAKVDELMTLVDQLEQQLANSRTLGQQLLEAVVAELTKG